MRILILAAALLFNAAMASAGDGPERPAGRSPHAPGIISSSRIITVHRDNYARYLNGQRPDSAIAYLVRSKKGSSGSDAKANSDTLDRQLHQKNILYFRCFYRNGPALRRFVDLSPGGALQKEVALQDTLAMQLEIRQYYPQGALRSTGGYKYLDSLNLVGTSVRPWYAPGAELQRAGKEMRYHLNGRPQLELDYMDGKRRDGVYTDWDDEGAVKATYEFRDGKLVAVKRLQPIGSSERKAFLFGQDLYEGPKGRKEKDWLMDLNGCYNDITKLKATLEQSAGFEARNVLMTGGEDATRAFLLRAFDRFVSSLNRGDKVFLHFSSSGFLTRDDAGLHFYIPCRDIWKYTLERPDSGAISQAELLAFLNRVQRKVGRQGQVLLSLDACHAGVFLSDSANVGSVATNAGLSLRGEQRNFLFDFIQKVETPSAILSATTREGYSMETRGPDGKTYGLYSYYLAEALSDPTMSDLNELFRTVSDSIQKKQTSQQPGFLARGPMRLFEAGAVTGSDAVSLPALRPSGNTFNLSVGISQYPRSEKAGLSFANARSDAESYHRYFGEQFARLNGDSAGGARTVLLQDEQATKEEIICFINEAISSTRPNDYFVFNFSGYCRQLTDSAGKKQTWFVPYGLTNIGSDAEIREKGISLSQLKELLQLIPANNQLFISEAGATPDFQREFIQALIETSPTIAGLSKKNRVFLVPKTSGADNCPCKSVVLQQGPLNHYITSLPEGLNIYGLFADSLNTEAIRFALAKAEVECDYFRTGYFDIFFERDFIRQMKLFLPEEVMQSRGIGIKEKERKELVARIGRRVAFIVGTNEYAAATQWTRLANPVADARAMADVLARNFGFDTILLLDKPADSIYSRLLQLAQTLQPSDQLLIYVGGHGDFDERLFDDGFIVTADSKPLTEDPFRNTYVQYSKLSRLINRLPPMQILTVLDVCFGGTFDERVARNKARGGYDDLSNAAFLQDKLKKRTRLYLTSGSKNVVPDGYAGRHSPFALRLLEAFETRGGTERMLTASALYQFVQKLPSKPMLGSFGDDEVGSEFVLVGR
ncbi:caspase family protein [Flaviaesturariibacter aridisoli]|uniref:Peptidase C14 caspase domain-containing protein n=1 Tax=Flaviaesturariibacter aridisoli TaxID=2545761 RepID=A0A4V2WMV9_9BACT|nr:caspase family protein [Flaviaesturariibacter aridisoli]TCZ73152.1 hypothetical protein E0486_07310 [Flaviaesturariibacter aridisoli]